MSEVAYGFMGHAFISNIESLVFVIFHIAHCKIDKFLNILLNVDSKSQY